MRPPWVIAIMVVMNAVGAAHGLGLIPRSYNLVSWAELVIVVMGNALALFGYPLVTGQTGKLSLPPLDELPTNPGKKAGGAP